MSVVVTGCDECDWEGGSSASVRRHHELTGHTCWVKTVTLTFYGDPLEAFLREHKLTRTTGHSTTERSSDAG